MSAVWRQNLRVWVPALAFFALNLTLLSTYRLVLVGYAEAREQSYARSAAELERARTLRARLEGLVAAGLEERREIEEFYFQRLATERQRLTEVIAEVKELARACGLTPTVINYHRDPILEYDLAKQSIVFAVTGSYLSLRKLVNLLELSDLFLILEQVSLSERGGEGATLRINLQIAAVFAAPEAPGAAAGAPVERAGP